MTYDHVLDCIDIDVDEWEDIESLVAYIEELFLQTSVIRNHPGLRAIKAVLACGNIDEADLDQQQADREAWEDFEEGWADETD